MSRLEGKRIFITGASSGIGAGLARELVARGARVGLVARREERLSELADELSTASGDPLQVAWAAADVNNGEALDRAFDRLAETLGGIDVMVANAGYGLPEPPHKFRPGFSMEIYDTNLFGMLRAIDWALPHFLDRREGHLVGVASLASYLGMTNSASYCGSKAAMRIHLQALRVSLKKYDIAVTTICPGFVRSELTDGVRYRMPFLWETGRATRKIADAIEKRRGEVPFPWQMRFLIGLATRGLPTSVLESMLSRGSPRPQDRGSRS